MVDQTGSISAQVTTLSRISALVGAPVRERFADKGEDILVPGQTPRHVHVLVTGHACRYRLLNDGGRQITAILVPGDLCDLDAALRGQTSDTVSALTPCTLVEIPANRLTDTAEQSPELTALLFRHLRLETAIAREWIVGLGRRNAIERLAHFFCEFRTRMAAVRLATEDSCEVRFNQGELGDVLGLTSVHVNRALQVLRCELITYRSCRLTIHDRPALEGLAQFDPAYLQQ